MATTIKSTELDFDTIKNNLKTFLAQQDEFADYNFEASGLSNILDVLAYNTHYNSLLANFALNESFLSTAQLRSSLVSLAGSLGYRVGSKSASCSTVNLYVINPAVPQSMTLPAGFSFSSVVDGKNYTFKTRQTLIATNNGSNQYYFQLGENRNVSIHEGTAKRKIFIAGASEENQSYIIPTDNLDLNTVQVRVYADQTTSSYSVYNDINKTTSIDKNSKIFVIKETPKGEYEVTFGNGTRLGIFPSSGNKIEILYDSVAGSAANGARTFTPIDEVRDSFNNVLELKVVTINTSIAGGDKEPIESIRKNAPYLYASQNRMVTSQDYAALISREYSNVISDIKSWGGEDNLPNPKYGTVFVSIVYNTVDTQEILNTQLGIQELARNLSVASFDIEFTDPVTTYLETDVKFQWNPTLTSLSQTSIEDLVKTTLSNYFDEQLGGFDKSYRRSNLLTLIDDTDPSILNSRADVKMQYRFIPVSNTVSYSLQFPTSISSPDPGYVIGSETFKLNNSTCFLRNRSESTIIEVIDTATGIPVVDNIGEYSPATGIIVLSDFQGTLISGNTYIKITATPANQSTINAQRNNVLAFDATASLVKAVITDTV